MHARSAHRVTYRTARREQTQQRLTAVRRATGRQMGLDGDDKLLECGRLNAVVNECSICRLRSVPDLLYPRRHGRGVHVVGARAAAVPSGVLAVWQRQTRVAALIGWGLGERLCSQVQRQGLRRRGLPAVSPEVLLSALIAADSPY